jgi:solute:Na+ symporter, SSS family
VVSAAGVIDSVVVVTALTVMVGVGLFASHRHKGETSAHDYFLASGRLPWWMIGAAFVSTSVSSEQIVGTVGAAYKSGMGVANWEMWSIPCYTILLFLFIPIYLKNNVTTMPDLLGRRFNPLCANIYSWVMLFVYGTVFMVPILYGGSLAFSQLTGVNFYFVLWGVVILVAVYTVKGGMISVTWTDLVQCLMLVGGGTLLFFIALNKIPGGWQAMVEASPERFHLYRPPDDPTAPFLGILFGTLGVFVFYQAANQVMIQRVLGARTVWDGLMGIIFSGFINFLRPLVTCFLGFIVYHWIHVMKMAEPLDNIDKTFPFAMANFAPTWGLRGIILAGFLSAIMAAISGLANSTATLFSLDVYKKIINRNANDKTLVFVGRIASFTALAVAACLAPMVEKLGGVFKYFQTGVTYVSTPFIAVILMGLLWKRANSQGAVFGLIGGIVIQIFVALIFPWLGYTLHWLYIAFIAEILIICGIVVVSLWTPPPSREQWEPFLWTPKVLSSYDEGIIRPWYKSIKLWYGIYASIWVGLYWYFW